MTDTTTTTETAASVELATEEITGEGNALERASAYSRELILGARDNPDGTVLPGGATVTETRRRMYEQHIEEGRASDRLQEERARELSMQSDPLYSSETVVVADEMGLTSIRTVAPAFKPDEGPPAGQPAAGSPAAVKSAGGVPPVAKTAPQTTVTRPGADEA